MITVSHLTRRFGSLVAVDDVSFQLERGEVVGFLGPNGAGKTTTMRMLTGFLPATAGTIEIAGFDVLRESLQVRRKLGYLPEAVPLYREHRVEEMLAFQGQLHRMPRKQARRRTDEVLERVGLGDRKRSLIGRLSKGQRQRIGIARALVVSPRLVVADEPVSALDVTIQAQILDLMQELGREYGLTMLFVSHDLAVVRHLADRILVLYKGEVVEQGSGDDLFERPQQPYTRQLLTSIPGRSLLA